ncbi:MAG: hypothetical protein QHH26_11290 [Armatimonadota bacterium]|nr:hypothetical protein [Armatimonadota bacterium]
MAYRISTPKTIDSNGTRTMPPPHPSGEPNQADVSTPYESYLCVYLTTNIQRYAPITPVHPGDMTTNNEDR